MQTAIRLGGYAAVLALAFGAAWGAGVALGAPAPAQAPPADDMVGMHQRVRPPSAPATVDLTTGGLAATAGGYTLTSGATTFTPGSPGSSRSRSRVSTAAP